MQKKKIVIAIDGYSSCGKSTVAKSLARKLTITYVDTGAMYRAVTYFCLQNGLIVDGKINESKLEQCFDSILINFKYSTDFTIQETYLNNVNIEKAIRGLEVSSYVSPVSKLKFVRQKLVTMQRALAGEQGVVMDGRDIGTVVLPHATYKFFMTADADVRAKRRYDELTAKGENPDYNEVKKNIIDRDYQDENRSESPLRRADDAIILDNSYMNQQEQLAWIIAKMNI